MKQWKLQLQIDWPHIAFHTHKLFFFPSFSIPPRDCSIEMGEVIKSIIVIIICNHHKISNHEYPTKGVYFLYGIISPLNLTNNYFDRTNFSFSFRCQWLNPCCVPPFVRKIETRNIDCVISFSNFIDIVFFFFFLVKLKVWKDSAFFFFTTSYSESELASDFL